MSIVAIYFTDASVGWQARWPRPDKPGKRWTKYFAADRHGGLDKAHALAVKEEKRMKRQAKAIRCGFAQHRSK